MGGSLRALTTRGRSFAAAGTTAITCAFLLGQRDLLRAGVLLLTLPLLSVLLVSRARYRLTCVRRTAPLRSAAGQELRIDLVLENAFRLPTGVLLVEDQVPYALGGRPRFVVGRIEPHGRRTMTYTVRADTRGRYTIGPLTVRLADPFGLVELARAFTAADQVVVTPRIVPLPPGAPADSWADGAGPARTVSAAGEDDAAPREYRHGDDLRRVHWRSTARHGRLMVRQEEQQWQARAALFLDTRQSAHWGHGPGSSFEQAVSAAASIGVRLADDGLPLRYVTDEGATPASSGLGEGGLLDLLAMAHTSAGRSLRPGATALREATGSGGLGGPGGLLVGVFGLLTAADAHDLAPAGRGAATRVAVLVEPGEAAGVNDAATAVLRAAGWRVMTVRSAAALARAWAGVPSAERTETP